MASSIENNTTTSSYSLSVERYTNLHASYASRSGLIPYDNKNDLIDYLTKTVIFHGGLAGPLSIIASYFSSNPKIITADSRLEDDIKKLFTTLDLFRKQTIAWTSAFIYNHACLVYLPRQDIEMTCPNCKSSFMINNATYSYPFQIVELNSDQDYTSSIRRDSRLSIEEKNLHPRRYGIKCVCPNCQSKMYGPPNVKWRYHTPGKIVSINPKLVIVDTNDAGEQRVIIDPASYKGKLALYTDLEYFDLIGMPWGLITAYASKEEIYLPDTKYCFIFSLREYAGIGTSGGSASPLISAISDTISLDIFKLGTEGIAFSKINPLYVLSPVQTQSGVWEGMSHQDFKEFILDGVKAHQEGDINRLLYSPMPVDTSALFGDGKRFMSINEMSVYSEMIISGLGFSIDMIRGGSGFTGDPVKFEAWNNIRTHFNDNFIAFLVNICKLTNSRFYKAEKDETTKKPVIWIKQLSQLNNGLNLSAKWDLADKDRLPIDEVFEDIGIPSSKIWRDVILRQKLEARDFENTLAAALDKQQNDFLEANKQDAGEDSANIEAATHDIQSKAMDIANQLSQIDEGQKKSQLNSLQKQNFVLYATVVKYLEDINQNATAEAKAMVDNSN